MLSFNEITSLAKEYNTIPIYTELPAKGCTPINMLKNISQDTKQFYLLESSESEGVKGRYSFLGYDPRGRVQCKNGLTTINDSQKGVKQSLNPLVALKDYVSSFKAPTLSGLPPFSGGFAGYIAYDFVGYTEPSIKIKKNSGFNDLDLMVFDKVIVFDHLKQMVIIVVNIATDDLQQNYQRAVNEIEKVAGLISKETESNEHNTDFIPQFSCNVTKDEFCQRVMKIKKFIKEGDIFQGVLSRRFATEYKESLFNAYRVLRKTNPSQYMVFMENGDLQLISASPETLVKLEDGIITASSIAGSRPRGNTLQEDLALERELLADPKELAEHEMLVDTTKNDLGKIADASELKTLEYKKIHRYSRVMHITTRLEGNMQKELDALEAIKAFLPAGTVVGAPKKSAYKIIDELEKEPRGIYGGALGYITFTGNVDVCIAIRMAIKKENKVFVQAGGGVVADSIPEREYEESENKARAIMEAIQKAKDVGSYGFNY